MSAPTPEPADLPARNYFAEAIALIDEERHHQRNVAGWSVEADREHGITTMIRMVDTYRRGDASLWPFPVTAGTPRILGDVSNLTKAGALAVAIIDAFGHIAGDGIYADVVNRLSLTLREANEGWIRG